jgi:hypothetical protein
MAKQYVLTDITRKLGRLNQSDIWDLTWLDTDQLKIYMMVVDSSYRNYSKWRHIIDNNCLGIYTGMRLTNRRDHDGVEVMSADSQPQLISLSTEQEIFAIVDWCHQQKGLA